MEFQVKSADGAMSNPITVSDETFTRPFNEALVHQVVVACLANARAGTRAQKTRAEVRGGGIKPWRQKGTGRARSGSTRSPIWRGGGVTFAAKPQDHSQKVNRKMYRAAMRSIFSELARQGRLVIVEGFSLPEIKTKHMIAQLRAFDLAEQYRVLLVTESVDRTLFLSARNLQGLAISDVSSLNPVSLVGADTVVITVDALRHIGEWLA